MQPPLHNLPDSDEVEQDGAASSLTSERLSALLSRHGIAVRHQATEIAHICAISVSQARRKLRGAVWLFEEVTAICRHFGESLDTVFASTSPGPSSSAEDQAACFGAADITSPATFLLDGRRIHCDIQLGAMLKQSPQALSDDHGPALLATHHATEGWLVASPASIASKGLHGPHYAVQHLQVHTPPAQARARIAVLDDDAGSADALTDWFNELGYAAQSFTHPEQLLASSLTAHDAYVIDLILGGGRTSQSVVEQIRHAQPHAPIVLLTGQLRDGTASEATLTTILRTQGVTFFEKPVRPAVLTAAIQSSLDRLIVPSHA